MAEPIDSAGEAAAAIREMVARWVSLSNTVAEHTLGRPGAAPPTPGAAFAGIAAALGLPTAGDLRAVADAVAALDARLAWIEARLPDPMAGNARSAPATPRSTPVADLSQIKEHMNVIGADGVHVGTVDHIDGNRIKLTKNDSSNQHHHWISVGLIADVEGNDVRLSATGANAVTFEEDK